VRFAVFFLAPLLVLAQDDKPSPFPNRSHRPASKSSANAPAPSLDYKVGTVETGEAVFFSKSLSGRKAASGEVIDIGQPTAAHALYPFGSVIRVTNTANNRSLELRVMDRISTSSNKLVSVSHSAAEQLGFLKAGSAQVKVQLVALGANR
jgi:rare lipoprotein A